LTIAAKVGQSLDAAFSWEDLSRLRDQWKGKLLVKGVEHPLDAARLASLGVDAVWISNHGGRQLDGALATADALPAIAKALAGKVDVIIDSGVRRGVDILKARALGAQAVAVGRAVLFGAAVAGEAGARHALQILIDELQLSMKLSGVGAVNDAQELFMT
jgi:L-lactate dehydrogenase (cytochrome)/(S)-mandelate dehydrogenase